MENIYKEKSLKINHNIQLALKLLYWKKSDLKNCTNYQEVGPRSHRAPSLSPPAVENNRNNKTNT